MIKEILTSEGLFGLPLYLCIIFCIMDIYYTKKKKKKQRAVDEKIYTAIVCCMDGYCERCPLSASENCEKVLKRKITERLELNDKK